MTLRLFFQLGRPTLLGSGTTLGVAFRPGAYEITERASTTRFLYSLATTRVTVVHTKPPELLAPAAIVVAVCGPGVQAIAIPEPTVIDKCAPYVLSGNVVSTNGQAVSPIPIIGGIVTLAPATLGVVWTATDQSNGLSSTLTQAVDILAKPTLAATDTLDIDQAAQVVAGSAFGTVQNSGTGATAIAGRTMVDDVLSASSVTLGQGANVNGWIKTQGTVGQKNNASVLGPILEHQALLNFFPPPSAAPTAPPPGSDLFVPPGGNQEAAPGSYGQVTVKPNGELGLSSGIYFMTALDLQAQATIRLNASSGPVYIYVSSSVLYHGAIIDPLSSSRNLLLEYTGSAPVVLDGPFAGAAFAPSAQLELKSRGAPGFVGEFFAKSLKVDSQVVVTHQPFSCP